MRQNYGLLKCCTQMIEDNEMFEWNKDIYEEWHWIVRGACIDINFCPYCGREMPKVPKSYYIENNEVF